MTSKKTPKFLVSRDRHNFDKEASWENEPGKWVIKNLVFDVESQEPRPGET